MAEVRRKAGSSFCAAAGVGASPRGVSAPPTFAPLPRMTENAKEAILSACSTRLIPSSSVESSSARALVAIETTASQLALASLRTPRSLSCAAVHQAPT
jgi:hypothetical protein